MGGTARVRLDRAREPRPRGQVLPKVVFAPSRTGPHLCQGLELLLARPGRPAQPALHPARGRGDAAGSASTCCAPHPFR